MSKSLAKSQSVNQLWLNQDQNKYYLIKEGRPDSRVMLNGTQEKKFIKNMTGIAHTSQRKQFMKKKGQELLSSIKRDPKNYLPQPNHLDGYTHFPRPLCKPYTNKEKRFEDECLDVPATVYNDILLNDKNKASLQNHDFDFNNNNRGTTYFSATMTSQKKHARKFQEMVEKDVQKNIKKYRINDEALQRDILGEKVAAYKRHNAGRGGIEMKRSLKLGPDRYEEDTQKLVAMHHLMMDNVAGQTLNGRKLKSPTKSVRARRLSQKPGRSSRSDLLSKSTKTQGMKSTRAIGLASIKDGPSTAYNMKEMSIGKVSSTKDMLKETQSPAQRLQGQFNMGQQDSARLFSSLSKVSSWTDFAFGESISTAGPKVNYKDYQLYKPIELDTKPVFTPKPVEGQEPVEGEGEQMKADLMNESVSSGANSNISEDPRDPLLQTNFKTQKYLNFKMKQDKFNEDQQANQKAEKEIHYPVPRNKFKQLVVPENGDQWRGDREICLKANPTYQKIESNYLQKDLKMLQKRKHGRELKNMALSQDLAVFNRKIDKELRKKIF